MINLALIGTGNVAFHLAKAFSAAKGVTLNTILGRNPEALREFEQWAPVTTKIEDLKQVDVILIAVSDAAIEQVSVQLKSTKSLVLHTSGSTSIEALSHHERNGVFYPLQTFSKGMSLDYSKIPFCIEAKLEADLERMKELARTLQAKTYRIDSKERASLHLAAVFSNNFSNHILTEARQICKAGSVSFELLKPLMEETIHKAFSIGPEAAQTGPARRGDALTIAKQLHALQSSEQKKLYTSLTEALLKHYER